MRWANRPSAPSSRPRVEAGDRVAPPRRDAPLVAPRSRRYEKVGEQYRLPAPLKVACHLEQPRFARPQPIGGLGGGYVGAGPAEPALCPCITRDETSLARGSDDAEVSCGRVRGSACRSGHRQSGDVRPDDLQGSSQRPVQAGRGPLLLVVSGCGAQGLHRLREGDDGADCQQRPEVGDRRRSAGDLVRSRQDP
jgi:hypothetical protein